MSLTNKTANAQLFRLMLYRRALHPELFELKHRRTLRHGEYEAECWVMEFGHVARFSANGKVLTEAVLEGGDHLPETGLVHALPCLGEKDFELPAEKHVGGIGYVTTVQTENLTENLYNSTLKEMKDFAYELGALKTEWTDAEGVPCMAMLDLQKYKHEFHVQSYHLMGGCGVVLRTQSIFSIEE